MMKLNNIEVRTAIEKKRLRYYEVAKALGITQYTFSRWMQNELSGEQKKRVLKVIKEYKI